jgi:hypothetical protein
MNLITGLLKKNNKYYYCEGNKKYRCTKKVWDKGLEGPLSKGDINKIMIYHHGSGIY